MDFICSLFVFKKFKVAERLFFNIDNQLLQRLKKKGKKGNEEKAL